MSIYTINFTDPAKTTFTVPPETVNGPNSVGTSTDLYLFGKNSTLWGEIVNENFVQLLENFASPEIAPATPDPTLIKKPIEGQLWYNSTEEDMYAFTGTDWKRLAYAENVTVPPLLPSTGDLWYDTTADPLNPQLKVYDGAWNSIALKYLHMDIGGDVTGNVTVSGTLGVGVLSPTSQLHIKTATDQNLEVRNNGGLSISALDDAASAFVPLIIDASSLDIPTGTVSITGTAGGKVLRTGTGTSNCYDRFTNDGVDALVGIESSVGGTLITGSSPYDLVLNTIGGADSIQIGTNNTIRMTVDGASGVVNFTTVPTIGGTPVWYAGNDGTGSGLDADLLDGLNSTSLSTVSTIVARDSSGDINARLFKSEYDTTNPTVNFIMTQIDTAANNYMRPSTVAQVKTAMALDSVLSDAGKALSTQGYQKLSNGFTVQWGRIVNTAPDWNRTVTVNFPVAFPTACYGVTSGNLGRGHQYLAYTGLVNWFTQTQVNLGVMRYGEGGGVSWVAFGF